MRAIPACARPLFAAVLQQVLGHSAGTAASALGALIIFATLMGGTWATSRIAFATARERLLPARLVRLSSRSGAPTAAIALSVLLFGMVVVAHGSGLVSLDVVFRMSAVNFVVGYTASVLAYGVLLRNWWHRIIAVVALIPVVVVLVGFTWLMLYPACLIVAGMLAHRMTATETILPRPHPE